MKAVELLVSGRVQGVYFRASTRDEASKRGLTGWCMNNADGSVSAFVQGEAKLVDEMIEWCRKGPMMANVINLNIKEVPLEDLSSFEIRRY